MFEFLALVDSHQATAVYDPSSSVSYISLTWKKSLGIMSYSQQKVIVSVPTSTGSFTCSVDLLAHPGSELPNVILGHDWFSYCTSACQNEEVHLIDGRQLVFSGLPFHAVFAKSVPGEFCICSLLWDCSLLIFYMR